MSEKKRVLIICRSSAGQMYLGVLLSRIWFSSILARTADEGIRLARKSPFSLTFFDGELLEPELQTAITLLRTDPVLKDHPLVVFMTNDDPANIQALLSQGCSAVLTKPLDLALMYGVLSRLCGHPRTTPRTAVKMRVELAEGLSKRVLTSVNLSEGGIYLRTLQPLPEGQLLHIRFTLPHDTESIELPAEVVRTLSLGTHFEVEPGMGLRFVDIPRETLLKIRNFIQLDMIGDLEWNSGI